MKISKYNGEGYHDPTTYEALTNIEKERRAANVENLKKRISNYRPLVYVCSPYAGNVAMNVLKAKRYCRYVLRCGGIPIAPHLLFPQFLDDMDVEQRELGLFMGIVLLSKCVEVWVFGEYISSGMAAEIDKAEERCMRVRYFSSNCEEVGR